MPFAEVYAALEQKVIDSVEAQLPAGEGAKLFEVTKVLTKTGHINLITGLVTSAAWFDSLPADLQTVLRDEALQRQICTDIAEVAAGLGFAVSGPIPSPIEGGDGNREFLLGGERAA